MNRQPHLASFLCMQCHTRVSLMVDYIGELRAWTCAGCRLPVHGRPMPERFSGVSGIQRWLGEQLVAELSGDAAAPVRATLVTPVGPALRDVVERVVERKTVLVASLGILVRVLLACEGLPLTPEGVRLVALARAGDLAGMARAWHASVGTSPHDENETAVMLEGPPPRQDRARGRWFGWVLAFLFREEDGGLRLRDLSGWEGSWQGPPR